MFWKVLCRILEIVKKHETDNWIKRSKDEIPFSHSFAPLFSGKFHKTYFFVIYAAKGEGIALSLDSDYATRGINDTRKSLMELTLEPTSPPPPSCRQKSWDTWNKCFPALCKCFHKKQENVLFSTQPQFDWHPDSPIFNHSILVDNIFNF